MPKEIEKKFLVKNFNDIISTEQYHIKQCYLSESNEKVIRLRVLENKNKQEYKGFITIKGKTIGISKLEYEYEIPFQDALEMIIEFGNNVLSKTRHIVYFNHQKIEVDVFEGQNEGLIVAEIELSNENQSIDLPSWIGEEVSYDKRYFNNNLLKYPFKTWN